MPCQYGLVLVQFWYLLVLCSSRPLLFQSPHLNDLRQSAFLSAPFKSLHLPHHTAPTSLTMEGWVRASPNTIDPSMSPVEMDIQLFHYRCGEYDEFNRTTVWDRALSFSMFPMSTPHSSNALYVCDVDSCPAHDYTTRAIGAPDMNFMTYDCWYHIAATWDASFMKFYLNGELYASVDISKEVGLYFNETDTADTNCDISLGYFATSFDQWSWELTEMRMWNVTRTANEIVGYRNTQLGPSHGLIGLWRQVEYDVNTSDFLLVDDSGFLGNMTLKGLKFGVQVNSSQPFPDWPLPQNCPLFTNNRSRCYQNSNMCGSDITVSSLPFYIATSDQVKLVDTYLARFVADQFDYRFEGCDRTLIKNYICSVVYAPCKNATLVSSVPQVSCV